MASAPAESATSIFSISASTEERTLLVPIFAFTFVVNTRPIPTGFRLVLRCSLFAGMINRPAAISSRIVSASRFSLSATNLTSFVIVPARTNELIPKKYLPQNQRYNLVIEALFFKDDNKYGYIIIEQPQDIIEFELLCRTISTALKGAFLNQERQRLLDRLAISNKELEQFASFIAHDLKQPLSVISSSLRLLEKMNKDNLNSKSKDLIDYSIDGSNRMIEMISSLLNFSRLTKSKIDFSEIDLEIILNQVKSDLHHLIDELDVKLTNDKLPIIFAIKPQMIQLFGNLIGNAVKFHSEEILKIHIGVEEKSDFWIFSVKDNGIGIDSKNFERIFQIFQKLHRSTEYEGTGVGLAICKKIVQNHKGRIWVKSELGKGSTFFLLFLKSIY